MIPGWTLRRLAILRAKASCLWIFQALWVVMFVFASSAKADDEAGVVKNAFDPLNASILEMQAAIGSGRFTTRELVEFYLQRIDAQDPLLNSIARTNKTALDTAEELDRERVLKGIRSPLHGIPVLVKDNYETFDMPTSAGSRALEGFFPKRDAFLVQRLRDAGAIILGKTNMHEFAYGITTVGSAFGATRNPYDIQRNPGGSSGGTGAAIASNFAAVGMGSDTCGSIRIPASHNNLVGLRGTQGLASRTGIIPLSHTQDIGGPLARSVMDLALVLDVTVGVDPLDAQTADGFGHTPESYAAGLNEGALRGARLGLLEDLLRIDAEDEEVALVVEQAANEMRALGAVVERVRVDDLQSLISTRIDGFFVLIRDFKQDINAYLADNPEAGVGSLSEILERGDYHPAIEESLRASEAMDDASVLEYLEELHNRERLRQAITGLMAAKRLDALLYPTIRRKPTLIGETQPGSNCRLAANSGLPAISVPAGFTPDGLPVGIELLGVAWDEAKLLNLA
ncbi:MAG: amidase family protein, partial [Gammaproteobacteria bacterium]|nr:amidase family protein [Gammaproteobacteria bacterium]